jgi:hypothetical protein
MIGRLLRWLAWHRLQRHRRWLRREHVVYTQPHEDPRDWSRTYMRGVRRHERF